jgi:hypothetical protein
MGREPYVRNVGTSLLPDNGVLKPLLPGAMGIFQRPLHCSRTVCSLRRTYHTERGCKTLLRPVVAIPMLGINGIRARPCPTMGVGAVL